MTEVREIRRKSGGRIRCPRCGKWITLWRETDEWVQTKTGRWRHAEYGPASGECCDTAYIDTFDGMRAFRASNDAAREGYLAPAEVCKKATKILESAETERQEEIEREAREE